MWNKICKNCKKEFITNIGDVKFCSLQCYWDSMKGKTFRRKHYIKKKCKNCGKLFEVPPCKISCKFCSGICYHKWASGKQIEHFVKNKKQISTKISKALTGKKLSLSHRLRLSESHKKKDSVRLLIKRLRENITYKEWRQKIFSRDNWTCQKCYKKGGYLEAHHKRTLSLLLKEYNIKTLEDAIKCRLLWKIDNGITLCKKCHIEFHKRYGYKNNNIKQIKEFTYCNSLKSVLRYKQITKQK